MILESEDLHRRAYNAAFEHFEVRVPAGTGDVVSWSSEYYDDLQNRVGGGKPKMRHYFGALCRRSVRHALYCLACIDTICPQVSPLKSATFGWLLPLLRLSQPSLTVPKPVINPLSAMSHTRSHETSLQDNACFLVFLTPSRHLAILAHV